MCATVGIRQAFLQSDVLPISSQILAYPPDCVFLDGEQWAGSIFPPMNDDVVDDLVRPHWGDNGVLFNSEDPEHADVRNRTVDRETGERFAFLAQRPLYGSRHAPLRWWLKLASVLQKDGYRQMRADVCAYVKYKSVTSDIERLIAESDKIIIGLIVVHVDDIIYVGNAGEYKLFLSSIGNFRHGDVAILSAKEPFVFCGLRITLLPPKSVRIDQNEFESMITPLGRSALINRDKMLVSPERLRTLRKQFAGSALWLLQSRYDLSFLISQFQALMVHSLECIESLSKMISASVKICKHALEYQEGIAFRPLFKSNIQGYPYRLFGFADASFASIGSQPRMERGIMISGSPIYRNAPITCVWHAISFYAMELLACVGQV